MGETTIFFENREAPRSAARRIQGVARLCATAGPFRPSNPFPPPDPSSPTRSDARFEGRRAGDRLQRQLARAQARDIQPVRHNSYEKHG
jgi:hypothetical protein